VVVVLDGLLIALLESWLLGWTWLDLVGLGEKAESAIVQSSGMVTSSRGSAAYFDGIQEENLKYFAVDISFWLPWRF
jgi:hypothetical protein